MKGREFLFLLLLNFFQHKIILKPKWHLLGCHIQLDFIFICLLSEKKNYSLEVENYILFDENLLRA